MADRTISIEPLSQELTQALISAEFRAYDIKRIALDHAAQKAYVEFTSADDVESLGMKYDDGKVPAFHHAEIGFVDADFQWPQAGPKAHPVPVNEECLLRIYNCENLGSLSVEDILKPFSTFAIAKMARFDDSNEVVLEFAQKDDLEGVGMKFADGKVAALGHNATIDDENGFDARKFYERYQQMQSSEAKVEEKKEVDDDESDRFKEEEVEDRFKEEAEAEELRKKEEAQLAERNAQEQREREAREERERLEKIEIERQEKEEEERRQRLVQEAEEKERKQRIEREEREEAERLRQLKEEKDAADKQRIEQQETQKRKEAEAAEVARKQEQEREARLEKERKEREEKLEEERKRAEQMRVQQEKEAKEKKEREEEKARAAAKAEADRKAKEAAESVKASRMTEDRSELVVESSGSSSLPVHYISVVLLCWLIYVFYK